MSSIDTMWTLEDVENAVMSDSQTIPSSENTFFLLNELRESWSMPNGSAKLDIDRLQSIIPWILFRLGINEFSWEVFEKMIKKERSKCSLLHRFMKHHKLDEELDCGNLLWEVLNVINLSTGMKQHLACY